MNRPTAPRALPEGFAWDIEDERLFRLMCRGHAAATVTALDNGGARVAYQPTAPIRLRYEFGPGMVAGIERVERWATKWQAVLPGEQEPPPGVSRSRGHEKGRPGAAS